MQWGSRKLMFSEIDRGTSMTTSESILIIEAILAIPLILIGISHIAQKQIWIGFFNSLANQGPTGVLKRTFMFELWPATLIVVFHQDWAWPGTIITAYGHLLMLKVATSLVFPKLGLKSLQQTEAVSGNAFLIAGMGLLAIGLFCAVRVWPHFQFIT